MSYPALFLSGITEVRIRRRVITVSGKPREFVTLSITGRREIDQWIITLDPSPSAAYPRSRIQIIEEKENE